ncbi:MAG: DUF2185 domain-containing protein [Sutterella sp.]|nr:DUF2185 domain-containing protein [Sutterella sp.]
MKPEQQTLIEQIDRLVMTRRLSEAAKLIESVPEDERGYDLKCEEARLLCSQSGAADKKKLEEALRMLNELRDEGRADPRWHYRRGWVLYHLRRWEEAEESFRFCEAVLSNQPTDRPEDSMLDSARLYRAQSGMQIILRQDDNDRRIVAFAENLDPDIRRRSWFLTDNYVRALINTAEYPDRDGMLKTALDELNAVAEIPEVRRSPVYLLRKALALFWSDKERQAAVCTLKGIRLCDARTDPSPQIRRLRLSLVCNMDSYMVRLSKRPWSRVIPDKLTPDMDEMRIISIVKTLSDKFEWKEILNISRDMPPEKLPFFAAVEIVRAAFNISVIEEDVTYVQRAFEILDRAAEKDSNPIWLNLKSIGLIRLKEFGDALVLADKARQILVDAGLFNDVARDAVENGLSARSALCDQSLDAETLLTYIQAIPPQLRSVFVKREEARTLLNTARLPDTDGRIPKADAVLESIPASERNTSWWLTKGRIYFCSARYKEAVDSFREAQRLAAKEGLEGFVVDSIKRYIHDAREGAKVFERTHLMTDTEFSEYCADIEKHLGPVTQVIEGWYPMRLLVVSSKRHVREQYLVTAGLCYVPKKADPANPGGRPCELIMTIDESRRMTDYPKDPTVSWPATLIGRIAKTMQSRADTSIRSGSTFAIPGRKITEGTDFSALLLKEFCEKHELPDDFPAYFLELIPLYEEEFEYAALFSAGKLCERLAGSSWRPIKDGRLNVCEGRSWKLLIPRDHIRPVYPAGISRLAVVSMKILQEGAETGYFYREKPDAKNQDWDSGWFFFAGTESPEYLADPDNFPLIDLNTVCNYLPDVQPYLDADFGTRYVRGHNGLFRSVESPEKDLVPTDDKRLLS